MTVPKGGARTRSGPAADPNALRRARKDDAQWTTLPLEGRTGPAPAWPTPSQSDREVELWATMWAKPQALVWEREAIPLELVAMFVRQLAEAEGEKASAENRKTVRMMFADLYLTPDSMARARIRVAVDETEQKRTEKAAAPKRSSARDRMKLIDGNGA